MESLISSLHSLISNVVPMIVLLGLLIFVHELGHFLVAKFFKVRVETFSLGFGPKLFKFKRGDTVYAISAIPLGGYVKMFGDEPNTEITADQKAFSFNHKPVGQRIAVVLAGPLMNLFFAIVLFGAVAGIGETTLAPKVGDINPSSPAHTMGFRSGDSILSIGSQPVKTWDDVQKTVEANADVNLQFAVERADNGAKETVTATPKLMGNKNVMSWDRFVGEIEGLSNSSRSPIVGIENPDSIAAKSGLKTGDVVQSINGTKITKWRELKSAIEKSGIEKLEFEVERGLLDDKGAASSAKVSLEVPAAQRGKSADEILSAAGVEFPELFLAGIEKGSPAEVAGLKKGDRILSIDGKTVANFEQVSTTIKSYGRAHRGQDTQLQPLAIVVSREGKNVELKVAPNLKERMSPQGREERKFEIGIRPMIAEAPPATIEVNYANPIAALQRGVSQTVKWTSLTILSFVRLFQAEVSPKNIGGFLSIGQMAKRSWQVGISQFLNVMAIISINLFILNLLPVPVLDGGHLVFYSIEALRGAPLSMRKMEIAQQVGLFLLLALMVFALFNDVTRLFN